MEGEVLKAAAGQGIWALLFVVLLFYVLRTSGEREKKLTELINDLAKRLGILDSMKETLDRVEKKVEEKK